VGCAKGFPPNAEGSRYQRRSELSTGTKSACNARTRHRRPSGCAGQISPLGPVKCICIILYLSRKKRSFTSFPVFWAKLRSSAGDKIRSFGALRAVPHHRAIIRKLLRRVITPAPFFSEEEFTMKVELRERRRNHSL